MLMASEKPVWCAKCRLRIAPYDVRTVYQRMDYHQPCFLKLVREEADEERTRRALFKAAEKETSNRTTTHSGPLIMQRQ